MPKLPQGKIPSNLLEKILSSLNEDDAILVGPRIGFDSSIVLAKQKKLVLSTDPAIYIPQNIPAESFAFGAVHFVASDITVFGAYPRFMMYNLLVPVGFDDESVLKIASLINKFAKEIGVSIIGGHTGAYHGLKIPITSSMMIGFLIHDNPILPSDARPGDNIIVTKWLGLEFLVALYYDKREMLEGLIGVKRARYYRDAWKLETVIHEATLLAEKQLANAMHDITEGGLVAALNEVADASGLGFKIYRESLPLNEDIVRVFDELKIDPINVSSTGCLLASVPSELTDEVLRLIKRKSIPATIIGSFTRDKDHRVIVSEGKEFRFPRTEKDAFARFFELK